MTRLNTPAIAAEPVVPLEYGRDGRHADGLLRRASDDVNARVGGLAEFTGMLIGAVGGGRQLVLALGLAFAANGVGLMLDRVGGDGHTWLAVGAFLVGLVIPVPRRRA